MLELLFVSLIWAFSFGIIKGQLTGIDSNFVSLARLGISLLVLLPFLRLRGLSRKLVLRLLLIGAVQYGLMYVTYIYSFQYLKAYQVALFTIFTPLYVTILNNLMQRRVYWLHIATTLLAVAGTAIVVGAGLFDPGLLAGFLILQISNASFAFGQIAYKEVMRQTPGVKDSRVFALLFAGGVLLTGLTSLFFTNWRSLHIGASQWWALLYLGAIASGLCFFLWNRGARRVNAGSLAILNNLKIPLGIVVSLLFFGEQAELPSLLLGGALVIVALFINETATQRLARRSAVTGE